MRTQAVVATIALAVLFGAIFGGKHYIDRQAAQAAAAQGAPRVAVSTVSASEVPWSSEISVVGSLEAVSGTQITAQIAGNVTRVAFASGATVQAGDLLVQLDDSSQLADLQADEARLKYAQLTLTRARELFARRAVSESDLQLAQADHDTARAALERDRAALKKLAITAPFAGRLGIREVSLGQYVSPGTPIVNLQSHDPLLLNFSLPQSHLGELAPGQEVHFTVNAYPGRSFTGRVGALAASVDATTRNISLQASVSNADNALLPGMYGNVRLSVGAPRRGIAIPVTALTFSTFGDHVYVIDSAAEGGPLARQRVVQVQDERNGLALVSSGLAAGEVVVNVGQHKLYDGARERTEPCDPAHRLSRLDGDDGASVPDRHQFGRHRHDQLPGCQPGDSQGVHHHTAAAGDRRRIRHRLHDEHERAGALDDHRQHAAQP